MPNPLNDFIICKFGMRDLNSQ